MAEPTDKIVVETNPETTKLSHKKKKALLKKQRRKIRRQAEAQERDEKLKREEELNKNSPNYVQKLAKEEEQMRAQLLQIEAESQRQRELWEWHEEMYKQRLKQKEEQAEREKQQKLEIEKKIKEEWEERQKKEKEEEEEKRKKKEKQTCISKKLRELTEELLKQARDAENKDGDWSNPLAPVQYGKERQIETCPFFAKVAACRFGDRCSRSHPYPENSRTLLFSNMFRHFQLDQGLCEEYDTDIVLEYEDSEVYQKFKEFYEDTLPEFKAIGHVVQFKVCCNFQPHLRGNVYVSYSREDHALETYTKFNARWYGGKQISAQFVEIPSWRRAICGLFGKGRCPKGRECNFLHVFKNPSGEFNMADRDMESFTPRQDYHQRGQRSRDWRSSPSRSSRKYRHSRSRSRERHDSHRSSSRYSRRRSRSSDRHRSYSSRHRSRSPDHRSHSTRNRSRSPEYRSNSSRQRSRSPHRKSRSHRSKYRDRSGSESEESSRENTPLNENSKQNCYKDSKVPKAVSVDNIENYEKSVDDSDGMVWVEKTKENLNSNGTNRNYRAHSPDVENNKGRTRRHRSNSNSDVDSDDSYRKKHKKSKKYKRSKES